MKPFGDLNCIINEGMDEIMKKFIIFVIITLIIAVIGCGFYIWYNNIPSSEILGDSIYFNATTFTYEGSETATIHNADRLKEILDNLEYGDALCKGIANYSLKSNDGTQYLVLTECNGVQKNGKQASVSEEQMKEIENLIINGISDAEKISDSANIEIKAEEK